MIMEYSERLIRGISNSDFLDEEGRASAQLFQFDVGERKDGYSEVSVNWYDNIEALDFIMNQKKKDRDDYQFKFGAAIMRRSWLDEEIARPNCKGALTYERKPIEGVNPYHGNILQKDGLAKHIRLVLAASLANCIENIQKR